MKIFVVFNSIQFLSKFKLTLVNELSQKYDVHLVYPNSQKPIEGLNKNTSIYDTTLNSRGRNPFSDIRYIYNLNKLVRAIKPDLIISFTIKPNLYAGTVSKLNQIQHIMTVSGLGSAYHSNLIPKWVYFYFYYIAIGKRTIAFFENEHIEKIFKLRGLRFFKSININGSGVDLGKFKVLKLPPNRPLRFLFIGRLMNEKGIRELLLASINLLSQKFDFELHLLGELTPEVTEFIIKNRIELFNDKIKFISYVNDVSTIIKDSHVIIHPSYHEGMSNALLEAAACGRPLLASNIPGCREIIEHDVNGFLFEPKNIIEIESSMVKILSLSIKDLSNMGLASRKKVELIFDRKSINAEFMNLIEDIETGALK